MRPFTKAARSSFAACRIGIFLVAFAVPWLTARAQSTLPTVEDFFRNPPFAQWKLSPSGNLIAALVATKAGRVQLAVIDPSDFSKSRIVAGFSDADIQSLTWVNDRRLVFSVYDASAGGGDQLAPGLFAVDTDGEHFRRLVDRNWRPGVGEARSMTDKSLPWWTYLHSPTRQRKTDDVFVVQVPRDRSFRPGEERPDAVLLRLDTRTQQTTVLSRGAPAGALHWLLDVNDEPKMVVTEAAGKAAVHYRASSDQPWQKLREFDSLTGGGGFVPVVILADGRAVVKTNAERDIAALYYFDPQQRRLDPKPLVSVSGFDFSGEPLFDEDRQKLLGVHVNGDGVQTVWLDPTFGEIQKIVDSKLPRTVNQLSPPLRRDGALVLVRTVSDVEPPSYWLFNRKDQSLERVVQASPTLDPKVAGQTDFVRFKSRDGLSIPMYVTAPRGGKNIPTVVLVHGGPWVRGRTWGWNSEVQFLASRGYAVLEPEYRGSTGYGFNHFKAGWGQWGMAMQDDVADATRWAIAQGISDPNRICIAGASYGGYATLMGLAKEPELFRCGIAWIGVTDIDQLFTHNWTDVSESARRFGYARLIGDPQKDAAQLRLASPIHNASKIRQPLLLAYGAQDLRVPIDHGRRFREAVSKTNPDVDFIVYPDEGHGWNKVETRVDFWSRVEKFLHRHLGPRK
ncbi:MAG TPA: S9 family peptidase [Burkholderiaceae bacterium]|nr:S9 family peptidase [Burkholderiaceae bacterium]